MTGFTARDVIDQRGKTVVITGANTGIGYAAAQVLAHQGAQSGHPPVPAEKLK